MPRPLLALLAAVLLGAEFGSGANTQLQSIVDLLLLQRINLEQDERIAGDSGFKMTSLLSAARYSRGNWKWPDVKGLPGVDAVTSHRRKMVLNDALVTMNGVDFRTGRFVHEMPRYPLVRFPSVPPVIAKGKSVGDQIVEMREWFKAWRDQDHSQRDYRKYFKPVLCFLEAFWATTTGKDYWQWVYTPFPEDEERSKTPFLPMTVMQMKKDQPVWGKWKFEVICRHIKEDVPLSAFKLVDDLAVRLSMGKMTVDELEQSVYARFKLDADDRLETKDPSKWTLLDRIMATMPGRDRSNATTKLDASSYYHRWAHRPKLVTTPLSYVDNTIYVAATTRENVAEIHTPSCTDATLKECEKSPPVRLTYAIPIEIVYMTPLHLWNPYKLNMYAAPFKITPKAFFRSTNPAKEHSKKDLMPSGFHVMLPDIEGVGALRTRYPIMPIHDEGSPIWKRFEALAAIILEPQRYRRMYYQDPCSTCPK